MTDPSTTPGNVPRTSRLVNGPPSAPRRRYRTSAPRAGNDVEQQIRRRHRRAGNTQNTELDRQQETAPETPTGAVTTAINRPATKLASPVDEAIIGSP
jgi:hypothetical protein